MVSYSESPKNSPTETRNTMKQTATFIAAVMIFALAAGIVIANTDAQISTGSSESYTTAAAANIAAAGGDVTQVNVSSDASTAKWQGFWGNISGSLRLGDASAFYDWSDVSFTAVYAAAGNTVDWAQVSGLSGAAAREGKDTEFGLTSTDTDSINSTMGGGTCAAGTIISTADGVTPYDNAGDPGSWETCLAEDTVLGGLAATVFGTNIVSAGAQAFNGETVQYQLMVPVESGGTNYYFYLEI